MGPYLKHILHAQYRLPRWKDGSSWQNVYSVSSNPLQAKRSHIASRLGLSNSGLAGSVKFETIWPMVLSKVEVQYAGACRPSSLTL